MGAKGIAALGAGLLFLGIALFLAGAFVWTNNARHGGISPAVYWGLGAGDRAPRRRPPARRRHEPSIAATSRELNDGVHRARDHRLSKSVREEFQIG